MTSVVVLLSVTVFYVDSFPICLTLTTVVYSVLLAYTEAGALVYEGVYF